MAVASSGRAQAAGLLGRALHAAGELAPFYAANLLTGIRLLCVPALLVLLARDAHLAAWWLFVFAAATDAVDGFVAKRFNGVTALGTFLDPLADKLLVGVLVAALALGGQVPAWFAVAVIGRDLLLVLGAIVLRLVRGPLRVRPLLVGKASTLAQFLYVGCTMAALAGIAVLGRLQEPMLVIAAGLTVGSALAYAWQAMRPDIRPAAARAPAPKGRAVDGAR